MKRSLYQPILALLLCGILASCAVPQEDNKSTAGSAAVEPVSTAVIPTATPAPTPIPSYDEYNDAQSTALTALSNRLLSYRDSIYVYQDYAETQNNFTQKAKIWGKNGDLVKNMDENWLDGTFAGKSCIRCQIDTAGKDWGGWMFLNGYLPAGETQPRLNDGSQQNTGLDLSGADALRFYARGEHGGETVEFFTLGFGYDGEWGTPLVPYPDSAKKP